jgi:hypothetical protein
MSESSDGNSVGRKPDSGTGRIPLRLEPGLKFLNAGAMGSGDHLLRHYGRQLQKARDRSKAFQGMRQRIDFISKTNAPFGG